MLLDSTRSVSLAEDRENTSVPNLGRQTRVETELDSSDDFEETMSLGASDSVAEDPSFISSMSSTPLADTSTTTAPGGQGRTEVQAAPKPTPRPAMRGGNDPLGRKENTLLQWKQEMIEVANELAEQFTPLGLKFRPQILLATAMQEAAVKDPLNAVSFDNGLGIMQITPYKGKLDPQVAKAINWDNSKSVAENTKSSNWRNAKANLRAGAFTMLGKAKAIKRGVPSTWEQMDEPQRWRAVLYAYNAGEGSAISALKRGGPNASMISTYTNPKGQRVSHDYTKEIKEKMDYVDSHDPFGDGVEQTGDQTDATTNTTTGTTTEAPKAVNKLSASVGRGGVNREEDVGAVQERLTDRGVSPGKIDSKMGPKTIAAIETFQQSAIGMSDGLISPGKNTEKHLFGDSGKVTTEPAKEDKPATPDKAEKEETPTDAKEEKQPSPSWAAISANFNAAIPGTNFTWHEAFWLPSWGRHVKASDCTNISIDTLISNVEKQAAALSVVREAVGKPIIVHCWVRPPAYNKQIGGASNSAHLRGMATDFHCPGLTAEQVRQVVKTKKIYPGAGENNVSWVHLDLEHKTWFSP